MFKGVSYRRFRRVLRIIKSFRDAGWSFRSINLHLDLPRSAGRIWNGKRGRFIRAVEGW